mmetsp:Transcript_41684/g.94185  ORF Transcript_41684/g.94185 Transcript_41684/m.94185 type:complete len:301 (-) Transcript_41684:202-1104(-)|eukprot:CAMPEP_0181213638 /NCGR_PEP_ID=MMETSP1096-20121128/25015_1 /TAXON_ID=156174 ORGANISM="Chrysochromulina ericina, Strain CCMP281" /NCGR_SAMPLE_ID=MMETSP1096 /ASSEMBLY_ACC=CAM_ASM_000453 /LENGTH=300 /DNA_ID=CAMNT_0023305297 /DNA_START=49 /DNA_END=951 /DNA_ORIENTATION=+
MTAVQVPDVPTTLTTAEGLSDAVVHKDAKIPCPTSTMTHKDAMVPRTTSATVQHRTGAALWKKASSKMHSYHAVTHQVQHRATEKVGFGVAEHALEMIAERTLGNHTVHTTAHVITHTWLSRMAEAARTASCQLRSLGPGRVHCPAPPPPPPPPPLVLRAWSGALESVKIAIPLAGTFLVAHMAHHDLHRARHEQHKRGYCLPTLLFFLATVCDMLDAVAHSVIVVCMLAELVMDPHTLHEYGIGHHFVHEVHHGAMTLAICATVSMVVGEILSVHANAKEPTIREKLLAVAKKGKLKAH